MGNTVSKLGKTALEVTCVATGGNFGISDEGLHIGPLRIKERRIGVRVQLGPVNIGVAIGKNGDGTWTTDANIGLGIKDRAGVNLKAHYNSSGNFTVEPECTLNVGPLRARTGFEVDSNGNFTSINAGIDGPVRAAISRKRHDDNTTFEAEVGTSIGGIAEGTVGVSYENERSWSGRGNINIKKPGKGDFKVGCHVDNSGNWSGDASLGIQSGTSEGRINTALNKTEGFSAELELEKQKPGELSGRLKGKLDSNMKWDAELEVEKQKPGELSGRLKGKLDSDMKWDAELELEKQKPGELSGRVKGKLDSDMKWDAQLEVEKQKPGELSGKLKGKLDSDKKWDAELEVEKQKPGELSGRLKGKLDSDMKWDAELELEKQKPGELSWSVKGILDSMYVLNEQLLEINIELDDLKCKLDSGMKWGI